MYTNYTDADFHISPLIHSIGLLGENLVGVEVGVYKAQSLLTILENCKNVKKIYGIDSYQPYADYLGHYYEIDKSSIDGIRVVAYANILKSKKIQNIEIIEKDSHEAVNKFEDESIDFVFLDAYMNYDQAIQDLNDWYPKVKSGGLFCGDDYHSKIIQDAVNEFRLENNINNNLSVFKGTWAWIKK